VVLVHYADLPGEMRRLAGRLGVDVPEGLWPILVSAASFRYMRSRASRLAQGPPGILLDDAEFFRQGKSGAGHDALSAEGFADYQAKVADMAPADALAWIHHEPEPVSRQVDFDDKVPASQPGSGRVSRGSRSGPTHRPTPRTRR
jgi:aryl sulfotransferase